jgi:hypothetical protein
VPHLPSDRESFVSRGSDEDRRRGLAGQRSKATALARNVSGPGKGKAPDRFTRLGLVSLSQSLVPSACELTNSERRRYDHGRNGSEQ